MEAGWHHRDGSPVPERSAKIMKHISRILGGLGLFMIGLAALIYVLFGPPKTAQEKLIEDRLERVMEASKEKRSY